MKSTTNEDSCMSSTEVLFKYKLGKYQIPRPTSWDFDLVGLDRAWEFAFITSIGGFLIMPVPRTHFAELS